MPDGDPFGPQIADDEDAYRSILYPHWWVEGENRPSTAAFDRRVFSVDIASKSSPSQTAARFRDVRRIVEFNCGEARTLGFDTRDEPDDQFPDNPAHAHVYFEDYDGLGRKKRKTRIRKLIEICEVIEVG